MTSRTDSSAIARQAADMMEQNNVPLTRDWRGRFWQEFFEKSNGVSSGADILCGGPTRVAERVGELLFLLLTVLRDKKTDGLAYRAVSLILPPPGVAQPLEWINKLLQQLEDRARARHP